MARRNPARRNILKQPPLILRSRNVSSMCTDRKGTAAGPRTKRMSCLGLSELGGRSCLMEGRSSKERRGIEDEDEGEDIEREKLLPHTSYESVLPCPESPLFSLQP